MLVGYHLLLRDSGHCGIIYTNACVVITIDMVWISFAEQGFWSLCDTNITAAMVMLLEAYYVQVLLYNAAQLL
jgi:hypothetical protein